jgi:glycosyltransferase involved in cell wall biosynthesis
MHNPCALIPVYNHETAVPAVVHSLLDSGLPCLLVDDGSSPACAAVLAQLATLDNVSLLTLPNNQGKGSAVMAGFREAARLGFTHALQVDADGQHDLREVESFIDTSRRHPTAVICGYPEYDDRRRCITPPMACRTSACSATTCVSRPCTPGCSSACWCAHR